MDRKPLTVDGLRKILENADGDLPVYIRTDYYYQQPDYYDTGVDPNFQGEGRAAFTIEA